LAWEPRAGKLWTVVNERDELGSDLVPDYLTSVSDGPLRLPYSYYGKHIDQRAQPPAARPGRQGDQARLRAGLARRAARPCVRRRQRLPARLRNGAFIGQHGSWNRKPRSGYNVVFVPLPTAGRRVLRSKCWADSSTSAATPTAGPGWAWRWNKRGALLVADDVGNTVWRVTASTK